MDFDLTGDDDPIATLGDGTEHGNKMCCAPEIPLLPTRLVFLFLFGVPLALLTLWCLLFRAKAGVWSRLCPFDNPPATAHVYDVKH